MSAPVDPKSACCSLPPVQAEYTNKGSYKTIEDLNTYVTGPSDAKTLIISVYDIFGLTAQALQGADLTSAGTGAQVWMPDFLADNWAKHEWFSEPETKEKTDAKTAYFSGVADPAKGLEKLTKVVAHARSLGFTKVGSVGFCWGAKPVFLASDIDAKATAHPSFLVASDADSQTVPIALFPSRDEDPEIMAALQKTLATKPFASKNAYKLYENSPHGFAGARGDLKSEEGKKVFSDVYERITKFFDEAL